MRKSRLQRHLSRQRQRGERRHSLPYPFGHYNDFLVQDYLPRTTPHVRARVQCRPSADDQ